MLLSCKKCVKIADCFIRFHGIKQTSRFINNNELGYDIFLSISNNKYLDT